METHTLAYLLKEVVAEHGRSAVSVIAPTGKAAVRASQALRAAGVDLPATTVHSALMACGAIGIPDEDELSDEIDDYDGSGGYIESKFIVVDETSMINTSLMALLLSAISTGTNVLFVGDPHQLPPVGHGSPLRDLIAAGLPYGELTQVRRNAGQIVHACLRIKCGEEFESNEVFDLTAKPPRNLRVVNAKDEADQIETLEIVLRAVKQFHPIWGTQVIIARNKGGLITRKELNEKLQAILNPDGARAGKNPFRVGDKIICLKNSRQQVVTLRTGGSEFNPLHYDQLQHQPNAWDKPEPKQVYVANGEIGRVIAVSEKLMIARFSESDDIVKIPVGGSTSREESSESESDDSGRGCNFDLAYAVTCHKLQGSSAPFVIVVADQAAGGIATREWWYTAISRASQMCMIIGQQSVVRKQCLRVSTSRRKTFLAEAVAKSISDQEATDARS
jgi:exodeoxyribonuclease V alpha subunit